MSQQTLHLTIPTSGSFTTSIVQVSATVYKVEYRWYPNNLLSTTLDPCITSPTSTTTWNSGNNNYDATITWDDGQSSSPKPPNKPPKPPKKGS